VFCPPARSLPRHMDASVRKALKNLQGLLDEGFVTQREYDQRRKAILDKATTVDESAGTGRTSVFDRLGPAPTSASRATVEGAWGHDGFHEIYGGGAKKSGQKRIVTVSTGDLREQLSGTGRKGDLREKIMGRKGDLREKLGGIRKAAPQSKAQRKARTPLPKQCPW